MQACLRFLPVTAGMCSVPLVSVCQVCSTAVARGTGPPATVPVPAAFESESGQLPFCLTFVEVLFTCEARRAHFGRCRCTMRSGLWRIMLAAVGTTRRRQERTSWGGRLQGQRDIQEALVQEGQPVWGVNEPHSVLHRPGVPQTRQLQGTPVRPTAPPPSCCAARCPGTWHDVCCDCTTVRNPRQSMIQSVGSACFLITTSFRVFGRLVAPCVAAPLLTCCTHSTADRT